MRLCTFVCVRVCARARASVYLLLVEMEINLHVRTSFEGVHHSTNSVS